MKKKEIKRRHKSDLLAIAQILKIELPGWICKKELHRLIMNELLKLTTTPEEQR